MGLPQLPDQPLARKISAALAAPSWVLGPGFQPEMEEMMTTAAPPRSFI